jgi:MerR family mercuric resistance operon transcriptional regulator
VSGGLRVGEVAAAAGVGRETLRYYERRGLIAAPDRSLGGHRRYPPETVAVLRAVRAAQRLGFTLAEIGDLLAAGTRRADAGLRARAAAKLEEVERRMADLAVVAGTLREALDAGCDDLAACAADADCPIPFAELAEAGAPRA